MDVQAKLEGDEIVVTRSGTDFLVAYRKTSDRPNLVLSRSWLPPTEATAFTNQFRAAAFQAAVSKARELGWIVR
jgi:hypothetical protein